MKSAVAINGNAKLNRPLPNPKMDKSITFIQARLTRQDLISEVEINSVLAEMLTSNRGIVLENADLFDES